MHAAILVAIAIASQCSGGYCPSPSTTPSFVSFASPAYARPSQPVHVQPAQIEGRDYYVVRLYTISHNGLTFAVRGYRKDGKITWDTGDSFNVASQAAAARPAAKKIAAPPKKSVGQLIPLGGGDGVDNYGIEPEMMNRTPDYEATTQNAKKFVREALGNPPFGKMHVTIIGDAAARAQVVDDIHRHPAFAGLRANLLVQDYSPDEWAVDPKLGFAGKGKPTILVQLGKRPSDAKGGRVVFRANDYAMGPEKLAEAIRKADPDYRPSKDPGPATSPSGSSGCPLGFTRDHWVQIAATALLVFIVLSVRKGGTS